MMTAELISWGIDYDYGIDPRDRLYMYNVSQPHL